MNETRRPVAVITGGSRGIGAATALALAERGYDVIIIYRNKVVYANKIVEQLVQRGAHGLALRCDLTKLSDVARLFVDIRAWSDHLDLLILNAAGGLERKLVAADPHYPLRINRDAQLAVLDGTLPLMPPGGVIVFVTSHWAHLYGQVPQIPVYAPVAQTKYAGEQALRARQGELDEKGLRLIVVTVDLVEGTVTLKLLERSAPDVIGQWRTLAGRLPSVTDMGEVIVRAVTDITLPSGSTMVVGMPLDALVLRAPGVSHAGENSEPGGKGDIDA